MEFIDYMEHSVMLAPAFRMQWQKGATLHLGYQGKVLPLLQALSNIVVEGKQKAIAGCACDPKGH